MSQPRTKGRIVHYVEQDGTIHPAMCVEDWGGGAERINLLVFMDSDSTPVVRKTSVEHSADPKPISWHWPARA